jgi:hypothetical protein
VGAVAGLVVGGGAVGWQGRCLDRGRQVEMEGRYWRLMKVEEDVSSTMQWSLRRRQRWGNEWEEEDEA